LKWSSAKKNAVLALSPVSFQSDEESLRNPASLKNSSNNGLSNWEREREREREKKGDEKRSFTFLADS